MRARGLIVHSTAVFGLLGGLLVATLPASAKSAPPADAPEVNRALAKCVAPDMKPAERIARCTILIQSGRGEPVTRAQALASRGFARLMQKDVTGAIADFDESLRVHPSATAYSYRGSIQVQLKQYDRAIADLDRAIELDPANASLYQTRSYAHSRLGDHHRAIADMTKTIELRPNAKSEYMLRAISYERAGETDKAIADYQKALTLNPDSEFIRRALATIGGAAPEEVQLPPGQCSANDITHEERVAGCTEAIDSGKLTGWTLKTAYCNRGFALHELGEFDRIIAESNTLIGIDAKAACAYLNRGRALYYKKDINRAIADYTQTIKLDPEFHEAYANRGTAYHERRDYKEAIANYDAAIKINPDIAMYFSDRGNSRMQMGDNNRAIADLTRAIEIEPDYVNAYVRRGYAFMAIADLDRAEADFTKALELAPGDSDARNGRAQVLERQGKKKAAADREEPKNLSFENFRRLVQSPDAPAK